LDIPLKILIPIQLRSVTDFCIARFQDKTLQYPGPHWYIIIPTKENSKFLVIIITSKVEKRTAYYQKTRQSEAAECLVKISNNEFPFLDTDSVVNCNETTYLSVDELVHIVEEENGFKIEKENVPSYLKKEIVSAILKSPLISTFIGKLAKAANPL
jgi:hypothetical protein